MAQGLKVPITVVGFPRDTTIRLQYQRLRRHALNGISAVWRAQETARMEGLRDSAV